MRKKYIVLFLLSGVSCGFATLKRIPRIEDLVLLEEQVLLEQQSRKKVSERIVSEGLWSSIKCRHLDCSLPEEGNVICGSDKQELVNHLAQEYEKHSDCTSNSLLTRHLEVYNMLIQPPSE